MGKAFGEFSLLRGLAFTALQVSPIFRKLIPISIVPPRVSKFFIDMFYDNIRNREQNKVVRHDFIDLLIEVKNTFSPDERAGTQFSCALPMFMRILN